MKESFIVTYTTSFAGTNFEFDIEDIKRAMGLIGLSPVSDKPINLSRKTDSPIYKQDINYYQDNIKHLDLSTNQLIFNKGIESNHISLFALAPQPLLIYLGTLLNDKYNVEVFQCHRNSDKWSWRDKSDIMFITNSVVSDRNTKDSKIALTFSLSANIDKRRIYKILGDDAIIYNITIPTPNRNFVTNPSILNEFIKTSRDAMEQIKNNHGKSRMINIFPAMPNSLAIRFGMDYMPNTDNPLNIYDEVKDEGFIWTTSIGR